MSVPIYDRGLLLGDGLFETLLWREGVLRDFERHADRMERGCAVLGLAAPGADRLAEAALNAVHEAGLFGGRAAVRLTWTAGSGGRGLDRPASPEPRLIASAAPSFVTAGESALFTATVRRNDASPASRIKSLAYLDNVLARREARAAGADDALMLNTRGQVACAAAANLFWFEGERLCTPGLDCGVLDGVVRGRVLAEAAALGIDTAEVAVDRAALADATGLFLTNSLIGVRRVSALDGRAIAPSPLLDRLPVSSS